MMMLTIERGAGESNGEPDYPPLSPPLASIRLLVSPTGRVFSKPEGNRRTCHLDTHSHE